MVALSIPGRLMSLHRSWLSLLTLPGALLLQGAAMAAPLPWRLLPPEGDPGPGVSLAGPDQAMGPAPAWRLQTIGPGPTESQVAAPIGAAEPATPADATLVAAARVERPYLLSPSLGGGVPSGYVGGWGDYYIAGSVGTPGNLRGGVIDGSLNLGFGLGDPVRTLGVELNWGTGSIKNFNANGSFGVAVGRILINRPDLQLAVGGGLLDAYAYGNEAGKPSVNAYGAVTAAIPLRPGDPDFQQRLQVSVGGGGNSFSAIDANFATSETGFFGAIGVELTPFLGLSVGQSSRGTNLNLSLIPFRRLPIFVNAIAADVFNNTPFGTVGVLSVGWGDSLRRGFFSD